MNNYTDPKDGQQEATTQEETQAAETQTTEEKAAEAVEGE